MSKTITRWVIVMAVTLTIVLWVTHLQGGQGERPVQARISGSGMLSADGFERAEPGRVFQFPRDHGAHPEYQTEWWYYTGNLQTSEGRRFGYQLTFFRRALIPPNQVRQRESDWAASQVYLAHFTLSDISANEFNFTERISRGAAGLAGSVGEPAYSVWLQDWSVRQLSDDRYELSARDAAGAITLGMVDEKGPLLQGIQGYSQKGPQSGNASYYYSQTRLHSSGTVEVNGEAYEVDGVSWMDHEFSTSALAEDQVGWDWFSLQLDNDTELMLYTIRDQNGQVDPYSQGSLVLAGGEVVPLSSAEYTIEILDTWHSPGSGARYPAQWRITVPSRAIRLDIRPLMAAQELNVTFTYWEGAVSVTGEVGDVPVAGYGYVELTGYAHSMQGEF
ncbi:MAG: hypothetical protein HPY76_05990 [Anaerolineae bacterium]|nr:hypothetical protein [Anaerolineae bacterium]